MLASTRASGDNLSNPVFEGVTIKTTNNSFDNKVSGDARVRFVGTYENIKFGSEDKSILLLGAGSTLYYPKPEGGQYPSIRAFRAYFKIGENVAGSRGITSFNINYGDGTTGIVDNKRETITIGIPSMAASSMASPPPRASISLMGKKLSLSN